MQNLLLSAPSAYHQQNMNSTKRYGAFLSYNHRDRVFARWLHRNIEAYTPPQNSNHELQQALKPVFMDREELASSGDLAKSVRDALENSAALVVVCSPNSAASKWVNEEVRTFQKLGRSHRIFCIVASGDPGKLPLSHDAVNESCFPPALLFDQNGSRRAAPLAADVRPAADGKKGAVLKVIAGLLGVPYDSLRQREARRQQRRMWIITTSSLVGFAATSFLAISAWLARNEAQHQRKVAEQKTLTSQRTVDFLKSMFGDADPSQAQGEKITVSDVLRRAALQIDNGLEREHEVRGALLTTIAEVYTGLGSYESSAKLLDSADAIADLSLGNRISLKLARGDLDFYSGAYEKSIRQYLEVISSARGSVAANQSDLIARAVISLANAYSAVSRHEEARHEVVTLLRSMKNPAQNQPLVANALFALGTNEFLAGNSYQALSILENAIAVRRIASGPLHPDISTILNVMASAKFRLGDKKGATQKYNEALVLQKKILSDQHPTVAGTINNISRLEVEQRKFREAELLLAQSEQILTKQLSPDHDDFAFVYSNIALAKRGLGDDTTAEAYFLKALPIARKHKHRTLGLALADLSEIECRSGRAAQGQARLDEALSLAALIKPPEPWRAAYVEHIRATCALASKSPLTPSERSDAVTALRASGEIVEKHWTAEGLYGYEAAQRMKKFTK
jgi:tetratricopeptide (TPR) repeat protein